MKGIQQLFKFLFRARRISMRKALNYYRYPLLRLPGMMGYEERLDLFLTAQRELTGKGVAVEFGAFLGASTAAIQNGLRSNPQQDVRDVDLHVVDCFQTPIGFGIREARV